MGLTKRGHIWWVKYTLNGKRIERSTGSDSKKLADKMWERIRTEIWEGVHNPVKKTSTLTVGGLRTLWLDEKKHKRSIGHDKQRFTRIVEHFGETTLVSAVTSNDVRKFRASLE